MFLKNTISPTSSLPPFMMNFFGKNGSTFNPIALRKTKIVCNFGLSECNRVKGNYLLQQKKFCP